MAVGFVRAPITAALEAFVADVGVSDPFCVVGGRTQWSVGRRESHSVGPEVREVRAPDGVVDVQGSELIVRCGAGTRVAELDVALAEAGLQCPLDPLSPREATVGGVLSVGHSGVRRLRHGHVRDLLLEAQYVGADGVLRRAGAPVVKNVTGFDVCRLLVGSLGTLGAIGEVVLRCGPRPVERRWLSALADPWVVRRALFRPASILWDGSRVWVQLEGTRAEVMAERQGLPGSGWVESEMPVLPAGRSSIPIVDTKLLPGRFPNGGWIAEMGTGTVHGLVAERLRAVLAPQVIEYNRIVKDAFDPTGRCNPGVLPW